MRYTKLALSLRRREDFVSIGSPKNKKFVSKMHALQNQRIKQLSLAPYLLVVGMPIVTLLIFIFQDSLITYLSLLVVCVLAFIIPFWGHKNEKHLKKLELKCWYPEKIYQKNVRIFYNIYLYGSVAVLIEFFMFILYLGKVSNDIILFLGAIIFINLVIAIPLWKIIWGNYYKHKKISKIFKKNHKDIDVLLQEILKELQISYREQPISKLSFHPIYKHFVLNQIKSNVYIEVRPKETKISFNPVNKNNARDISPFQDQIDLKVRNLPDSSAGLFSFRR